MTDEEYKKIIINLFDTLIDIFGVDKAIFFIYRINQIGRGAKL